MAWETRERGDRYYTRSRRENGRVVREYLGKGPRAELEALLDEQDRRERLQERLEFEALRDGVNELDKALSELHRSCDEMVVDALTREGFHQHKGQWRKKRAS